MPRTRNEPRLGSAQGYTYKIQYSNINTNTKVHMHKRVKPSLKLNLV